MRVEDLRPGTAESMGLSLIPKSGLMPKPILTGHILSYEATMVYPSVPDSLAEGPVGRVSDADCDRFGPDRIDYGSHAHAD